MTEGKKVTVLRNGQLVLIGTDKSLFNRNDVTLCNVHGANVPFSDLEKIEDGIAARKTEVKIKDRTYKIVFE